MRTVYTTDTAPIAPLKPDDAPDTPEADDAAAVELAEYFRTPRYRSEVRRQRASHKTLLAQLGDPRRELDDYWRDASYGHASKLV